MRIEEGKFYRTRGGRKVGPVRATGNIFWPMKCEGTWWRGNGESCEGSMARMYPQNDIISEWTESPVCNVQRIKPGVYGPLRIWREIDIPDCERPDETPVREVEVSFAATDIDENGIELCSLNASDWRELARVALEIAEYLDGLD